MGITALKMGMLRLCEDPLKTQKNIFFLMNAIFCIKMLIYHPPATVVLQEHTS
jgi:hypothetical protein